MNSIINNDGQFIGSNGLPKGFLPNDITIGDGEYYTGDGEYYNLHKSLNGFEFNSYLTACLFCEESNTAVVALILNGWTEGYKRVVIAKLDLQSNEWVWSKKMNCVLVDMIETPDEPYYVVELNWLDEHPGLININFCNMGTGKVCSSQFHFVNGAEFIVIN